MGFHKGTIVAVATALALGATLLVAGWEADPDDPPASEVHFPISCSAASQRQFDRAVSLLHALTPAMAAGVTNRLWSIADVVNVLGAWEANQ